eukprot:scaffold33477_cov24-Tisochrysis_lutea.AAC.2
MRSDPQGQWLKAQHTDGGILPEAPLQLKVSGVKGLFKTGELFKDEARALILKVSGGRHCIQTVECSLRAPSSSKFTVGCILALACPEASLRLKASGGNAKGNAGNSCTPCALKVHHHPCLPTV